jgi:Lon-like protease
VDPSPACSAADETLDGVSRRTAAVSLAAVLLVATVCVAVLLPVPFVTTRPGPVVDTLAVVDGRPVVDIVGHRTYPTRGSLDLTTVSESSPESAVTLPQALQAWFDPHRELLPRDLVYPPSQSVAQVQQQNAEEMQSSQQNAVVAALRLLGIAVAKSVVVQAIQRGAPALGHLRAGDAILAVDGQRITTPAQVGLALQQTRPGDIARILVERAGKRLLVRTPTEADPSDRTHTLVGITVAPGFKVPFGVRINLGTDIGGPSAGTMFALAIVDKLTPGALTGGAVVAGTGEITPAGTVGIIGGIQQKIAGAVAHGSRIFLVPAGNCAEALGAGYSSSQIRLVRISTLRGAVAALHALAKNPAAHVPSCEG